MDIWLQDFVNGNTKTEEREEFAVTLCKEFANWTTKEEEVQVFASVLYEEFKH